MGKSFGKSHGHSKRDSEYHPIYMVWSSMKFRCRNKRGETAEKYYNRGITVCQEWQEFVPFLNWCLENGYKKGLTIDRIDNDKGYSPYNCRFTTYSVQNYNKRKPKRAKRTNKYYL